MEKVIDIQERIPSMRKKQRRRTNKKFLLVLAIFCGALLILLYFQSSMSSIGEIQVTGAHLHSQDAYIQKSGIQEGDSLWGFESGDIEKRLMQVEGVKSVSVSRKWVRDVTFKVEEYATVAYVEEKGEYALLLDNGEIFKGEMDRLDVPILTGEPDETVKKRLIKQLAKMDRTVFQLVSEIIYTGSEKSPDSLVVYMDDGYEVHAVIPTFAEQMGYYPQITAQLKGHEKGIIDMEVGTFFTPFSEVYGTDGEEAGDTVESEAEGE